MKISFAIVALCLVLAASSCGGGDATSSQPQETTSSTISDRGENGKPDDPPDHWAIGSFEPAGRFAAISEGKEKPKIDPSSGPAPKKLLVRDLEVGSGPAARRGDRVSVYYAGAEYENGKVGYGGWPPAQPASFDLGLSYFGSAWEESIEGMKAGGLREVIIPSHRLNGTGAVNYVIELVALEPAAEKPKGGDGWGQVRTFPRPGGSRFATVMLGPGSADPRFLPSHKPPPKKVQTRDLVVGDGAVADRGDRMIIRYFGANYKSGKQQFTRWPPEPVMDHILRAEVPWEKVLLGMRGGGLREAIIPSHLLYGDGTVDYVFKVIRVEDRP